MWTTAASYAPQDKPDLPVADESLCTTSACSGKRAHAADCTLGRAGEFIHSYGKPVTPCDAVALVYLNAQVMLAVDCYGQRLVIAAINKKPGFDRRAIQGDRQAGDSALLIRSIQRLALI